MSDHKQQQKRPKAVLVSVQLPNISIEDHQGSLAELGRLSHTLGYDVIATVTQRRTAVVGSTVIGEGKLKELAKITGGTGKVESRAPKAKGSKDEEVDDDVEEVSQDSLPAEKATMVIVDEELSPTQLRNLESATGVEVLDRTGVIIEIFHHHAKTREARIQVEIARLNYMAPRLRLSRVGSDRQGAGVGSKGLGETAHELDKRRIRDRIAELKQELVEIQKSHDERRSRRKEQLKIALIGYTNAGKSSLMRALTGSEVLVEDKLFATLDTTIRSMQPETQPRILVSDTVGFIKKLPHDLVASFRSTLDEAANASLIVYVVDASDPTFRSQLEVTRNVIAELDIGTTPSFLVLNKVDCLESADLKNLLREFPKAISLSTCDLESVRNFREQVIAFFEKEMTDREFLVPYSRGEVLGELRLATRVLNETHEGDGVRVKVRGFPDTIAAFEAKLLTKTSKAGEKKRKPL